MRRIESSSASGPPTSEPYLLRAIIDVQHNQWTSKEVLSKYMLGTKSNIIRIQKTLIEKDFVEQREDGFYLADPVLQIWLQQH
jgi:hypothetical protein